MPPPKGVTPPHLRKFQFKKGPRNPMAKQRRKSGKKKTTAMVRYVPSAPVTRYRTRTVVKKVRSGSGGTSVMKREHGAGRMVPGPFRLKSMGVAAIIGYSEIGKGFTALSQFVDKLPEVGKLPKEALAGFILNYFGDRSEWVDAAASAFLDVGAYKVGLKGFEVSGDGDDD